MSIFCNNKKPESNRNISPGFELFAGKWAIEVAIKSKRPDRYVVSTEDKEVVRIVREHGTEDLNHPYKLATVKRARVRFRQKFRYLHRSKTANSNHRKHSQFNGLLR